ERIEMSLQLHCDVIMTSFQRLSNITSKCLQIKHNPPNRRVARSRRLLHGPRPRRAGAGAGGPDEAALDELRLLRRLPRGSAWRHRDNLDRPLPLRPRSVDPEPTSPRQ